MTTAEIIVRIFIAIVLISAAGGCLYGIWRIHRWNKSPTHKMKNSEATAAVCGDFAPKNITYRWKYVTCKKCLKKWKPRKKAE